MNLISPDPIYDTETLLEEKIPLDKFLLHKFTAVTICKSSSGVELNTIFFSPSQIHDVSI